MTWKLIKVAGPLEEPHNYPLNFSCPKCGNDRLKVNLSFPTYFDDGEVITSGHATCSPCGPRSRSTYAVTFDEPTQTWVREGLWYRRRIWRKLDEAAE